MSKVFNITLHMIPNLNKILYNNLERISNCWYKDEKKKINKNINL